MSALLLTALVAWLVVVQVSAVGRDRRTPMSPASWVTTVVLFLAAAWGTVPRLYGLVT